MRIGVAAITFLTLLLAGCGSSAPEPKKEEAPPEPVTGLHALYQMYAASRAWAPDAQVYDLNSITLTDVKAQPGKAGAWQAKFVSPSLGQSRTYTFSVIEASMTMHKGIQPAKAENWNGPSGNIKPFLIAAAKKDSDQAYEVALKKAAAYAAKNPNMNILYQLSQTSSYSNAAWRIIWGESAGSSVYSVLIDASTGEYVETLH